MTEQELQQQISNINHSTDSPESKTKRIDFLKKIYADYQTRTAEQTKQKQQTAEAQLKSKMRTAYMQNPAATDEDFERDYPALKSDFLRGEALKQDEMLRDANRRRILGSI